MYSQLPLSFRFQRTKVFETFHCGPNAEAVLGLKTCAIGQGADYIFLWGESGMGKSHLLQSCCQQADQHQLRAAYIPLKKLRSYEASLFDGLENVNLVCIDDVDAVNGGEALEQGLFHFFNRIKANGNHLIMSGPTPPNQANIRLPDLKSRLSWGLTLNLRPLSDQDKLSALTLRAKALAFDLSPQVGYYLLARFPRDMSSLWDLLEKLDRATLVAKRRLTIPFVKRFLEQEHEV